MTRVVAAILEREGRVLICQRTPEQAHPLKWEFPGGKLEPGETPEEAVARELREELDIEVDTAEPIGRYEFSYSGKAPIELLFYRVTGWRGTPRNVIFHDMQWEFRERLRERDFLEGDRRFLAHYTGRMATGIKMLEPAQNEFLAQLESKSGKPSHFFRTMANRPEVLKNFVPLYGATMGQGSVDRRIKELVYLTCSYTNECAYCTAAHVASGKKAGISEDELRALQTAQDHGFNEAERAVIQYARELTQTADADDTRDELMQHFSDEQIVEITLVAAMANFTNRFNNGLSVEPEA